MPNLKSIRKHKQRGAFFFILGGLIALIAAARLAPPVHQAKVQAIGGAYAQQIATEIAQDFLLHAGAVDPKTWTLHPQAAQRIAALRPSLAWGQKLPPTQARALLRAYQTTLSTRLRTYREPLSKPNKHTPAQQRIHQALPAALRQKQAAARQQKAIQQRKTSLLSAMSKSITPDIYAQLGFGAAQEFPAVKAANPPTPASWGWSETWVLFVLGSAVALGGLLVWKQMIVIETRLLQQDEHTSGDAQSPFVLLASALPPTRALQRDLVDLDGPALCKRVDAILLPYLVPLVEVRQKVIDRFGMKDGAEILVTVAFAERLLNRVWSAAADGHLSEARTVFPDALHALEEAQQQVERLSS